MRRFLTALLLLTLFAGCTKDEPVQPDDLYGLWKFQGYGSHLADVLLPNPREVWQDENASTLVLESKGETVDFSGQAPVNTYFGTFRLVEPLPVVSEEFTGYRAQGITLGSTEMAGPPADMQREQRYFAGLGQLKSLYVYRQPRDAYDQLLWMTSETEYLSFVRKR